MSSIHIIRNEDSILKNLNEYTKACVVSTSATGSKGFPVPKCLKGHEMRFTLPQKPSSYRNAGTWRCDDCLHVFNDSTRPDFVMMRQPRFVCTICSSSRCTECAEARFEEQEEEDEAEKHNTTTSQGLDEMQCYFCKKRGDGLNGEGRLFRACTLKRKPIYLHEFCCLFAPEVYFDSETKKLVKVNKTVNSAQVRRLTCPLCKQKGTTLGCIECNASYHVLCALRHGVVFTGPPHWVFFCPEHKNCEKARGWGAKPGVFLKEWTDCFEDPVGDQARFVCEICHIMDVASEMIRCGRCRLAFHQDCLSRSREESVFEKDWVCSSCVEEEEEEEENVDEEEMDGVDVERPMSPSY